MTTEIEAPVEAVNKADQRSLYAKRQAIRPLAVRGTFRRIKWIVMGLTLAVYYGTPWIRLDRGAGVPDQAVLLDIPARRFFFFWIEIWPQEIYFLTGLLVIAALALFLATALLGRVWCGYACPQTVWTDLFVQVERLFEGSRNAQIRLARAPWGPVKIFRKGGKHVAWLVIAMLTGGAWVFYFADAPNLLVSLVTLQAPSVAYITIAILTGTTYLLGGLAREQVCIYMCPWPRIQGAMFDEDTLMVSYRADRGEPRGAHKKGEAWDGRGHCIDCNNCVAACPMGIDIRDGAQLECINCALCIDACDRIMDRVDLPRGLIGYDTFRLADARVAAKAASAPAAVRSAPTSGLSVPKAWGGGPMAYRLVRPRTIIYALALGLVCAVMTVALLSRTDMEVNLLRDRNPLYVTLADGSIRNGYTLRLLNKARESRVFDLAIDGLQGSEIALATPGGRDLDSLVVGPDTVESYRVFVSAPRASLPDDGSAGIYFIVRERSSGGAPATTLRQGTSFNGPPG
ncbi:MAG: cytochrome c oxidase accessory protein CcoG [Alphaproteobacteria bacterium]